jgi:aminoglycoside phosphotransferase (APT) family kinase protein
MLEEEVREVDSLKSADPWDRNAIDPRQKRILERTLEYRRRGPYRARTSEEMTVMLSRYFDHLGYEGARVENVRRMSGGASKEQFIFDFAHAGKPDGEKLVLRMDPPEGISQSCRGREAQLQNAMIGTLPVPHVRHVDMDAEIFDQPGAILEFVAGVTEPSNSSSKGVSGMGTRFDDWAPKLAPQFVDAFVKVHAFDWSKADLSLFAKPRAGTTDAALWELNMWSGLYWNALVEPVPIITLCERWLRENLPVCDKVSVLHCDLRIGNFMFEEPSGKFTAILDWELGHLGDYHEDIAWAIQRLFGNWDDQGRFLVSGLLPREEFIEQYQQLSGNKIDPAKLRFYEILNAFKCACMDLGQALRVAEEHTNHQENVLTWLGSAGGVFLEQISKMIKEEL